MAVNVALNALDILTAALITFIFEGEVDRHTRMRSSPFVLVVIVILLFDIIPTNYTINTNTKL